MPKKVVKKAVPARIDVECLDMARELSLKLNVPLCDVIEIAIKLLKSEISKS
jgi:hypothetical protein